LIARLVAPIGYVQASRLFLVLALACLLGADLVVSALDPWAELRRLVAGLLRPDLLSLEAMSVVWTVAFAVLGVGLGASVGFGLAIVFSRLRAVRILCAALRSVHELFWALLRLQVTGLSANDRASWRSRSRYAGIFAKVFAEMIEEADLSAEQVLPAGTSHGLGFRLCAAPGPGGRLRAITRSTGSNAGCARPLVLGFVGLPDDGVPPRIRLPPGSLTRKAAAFLLVFYL
jgi:phosphonate transport system permease protein